MAIKVRKYIIEEISEEDAVQRAKSFMEDKKYKSAISIYKQLAGQEGISKDIRGKYFFEMFNAYRAELDYSNSIDCLRQAVNNSHEEAKETLNDLEKCCNRKDDFNEIL